MTARAETPGILLSQAGIHFLLPFGFELSGAEVRGFEGPVELVLLEPQDGVVAGQPSSVFVAISVHEYEVTPAAAMARSVADLSETFGGNGSLQVTEEAVALAGGSRPGYRLDFRLNGVALRGQMSALREADLTVVVYVQGQPNELEVVANAFADVLASIGVGRAEVPELPSN